MKEWPKDAARCLRKNQTQAEEIFWNAVRNRKMNGMKFLRQHPIKFKYGETYRCFIADFYCAEKKLIIELDGSIHENQQEYDDLRTKILNQLDLRVIRIINEEIKNVSDVSLILNKIF